MKATIDLPDDLYRQVKARSALEGRAIREVTEELFRRWLWPDQPAEDVPQTGKPSALRQVDGEPAPPWFGILRKYARSVEHHDMEAIRRSIAAGVSKERGL